MKVLFDTNVILDVLLARSPHAEVASHLLNLVDRGKITGVLCATTVTTIHNLATKAVGRRQAGKLLHDLLEMFEVAPVDQEVLRRALDRGFPDFEDAVLHEAARAVAVAGIVTRNRKDFAEATLPVFAPNELLSGVRASQS
jgi:predicted nucleic acid-binding protein